MALTTAVVFEDEVPYTSCALCAEAFWFSKEVIKCMINIKKDNKNPVTYLLALTSSYCHGPSTVPKRQNTNFTPWLSADMHRSPTPNCPFAFNLIS